LVVCRWSNMYPPVLLFVRLLFFTAKRAMVAETYWTGVAARAAVYRTELLQVWSSYERKSEFLLGRSGSVEVLRRGVLVLGLGASGQNVCVRAVHLQFVVEALQLGR
jgi:hypothetical protein